MLDLSYNVGLVLASIAISMMAAFTGLWLTRGLSAMTTGMRQLRIAMAAIALGDGIWSMHFTAMLAATLPVPISYDVLTTLASLLIAILLSGLALLILHFGRRTPAHLVVAGLVLGLGILVMHYTGMAAMKQYRQVYSVPSIAAAAVLGPIMGTAAVMTAYGRRSRRNLLLGTLLLGSTVVVVHFTAMAGTRIYRIGAGTGLSPMFDNQELALVVLLSAFMICGAFLLTGATFVVAPAEPPGKAPSEAPNEVPHEVPHEVPNSAPNKATPPANAAATATGGEARKDMLLAAAAHAVAGPNGGVRVPIERRGHTEFVDGTQIAVLRAEGHYTIAYCCEDKFFCPWSISEAERRLTDHSFLRAHRSYLVNLTRVSAFERHRDGGICLFSGIRLLERVPVSRNRVAALREALAI